MLLPHVREPMGLPNGAYLVYIFIQGRQGRASDENGPLLMLDRHDSTPIDCVATQRI